MTALREGETPLLAVNQLKTYFHTPGGVLKAVDDVSFTVARGETLGIVGESGCGKSVTCLSILQLVQTPPGKYEGGSIIFDGQHDLLTLDAKQMRTIRGRRIAMIFQEPMTALNPVYTVGQQLTEALQLHLPLDRKAAYDRSLELLEQVRIANPEKIYSSYPFTLSGGMRQRVMIAMALSCSPELLIADEPTTALDVTIQAQILLLMKELIAKMGSSVIFITHDLGVIAETADRMLVMYAGRVCEEATTAELIRRPLHPYTHGLIESKRAGRRGGRRLPVIPGSVPSLLHKPPGCPFHPRCSQAKELCSQEVPQMREVHPGHAVACHFV